LRQSVFSQRSPSPSPTLPRATAGHRCFWWPLGHRVHWRMPRHPVLCPPHQQAVWVSFRHHYFVRAGSRVTVNARRPWFASYPPACTTASHATPGARSIATARAHTRAPCATLAPRRVVVGQFSPMGRSGVCETRLSHSVVHVGLGQNWPVSLIKSFSLILNCFNIFKGFSLIQNS
jgi:hypothetical protein